MFSAHRRSSRSTLLEPLECRRLLAAQSLEDLSLVITEFVADNNRTLETRTRSASTEPFAGRFLAPDWVELMNISTDPVEMSGMHLTDDTTQPTKWPFPDETIIQPGEQLIVFASGQNLSDPLLDEQGYLHTNFRLSSNGEYLALTDRDGVVVHAYAPEYPDQMPDISYGFAMETRPLIDPGAQFVFAVPQDDSLGDQWRHPGFLDATMTQAVGPIGFDRTAGSDEIAETIGNAAIERRSSSNGRGTITVLQHAPFTQSGRVTEWTFYSTKTHTITPVVVRQAGTEFEVIGVGQTQTSDGSGPQIFAFDLQFGSDLVNGDGYFFAYKDGDNDTDVSGGVRWESSSQAVRQYRGPQAGNLVVGQAFEKSRTSMRTFSLKATTVARVANVATNIESQMRDSSSLYARYQFDVPSRDILRSLTLHIRYEDGFIAYLNGNEVARRNAPPSATFESSAPENRRLLDANTFEDINLSGSIDALIDSDNVLAIHSLNDRPDSHDFLLDVQLTGTVFPSVPVIGFSDVPTPGRPNQSNFQGIAVAPTFSVTRGFFEQPIELEITTGDGTEATIYYTVDGSLPSFDNPTVIAYQQPVQISKTSVVRAVSHREGFLVSPPTSHTFIFPDDVADQDGIKSQVRDDPNRRDQMPVALLSLPTVSIATSADVITEAELASSMELIYPDGSPGFQVNAGLEAYGASSLSFEKKSLRISFKELYGPPKLNFDLFDDPDGLTEFNQILLRSGAHDSAVWHEGAAYIRNRWASDRQLEMGHSSPRGRFVHVYQNGEYEGLYEMMERPNSSFMASYFGGTEDDYDVINAGSIVDGDDLAWNALINAIGGDYADVLQYLDENNFADYLLLQFFGGNNTDWLPHQNWLTSRRRAPDQGFQFFAWDSDGVLEGRGASSIVNADGPSHIWSIRGGVRQYDDFLRVLGDRSVKYFGEQGMFSAPRLRHDIDQLANDIQLAMIAESARWGGPKYAQETWQNVIDQIKDSYAPLNGLTRAAAVIEQMRNANLIPQIDPPQFLIDGQLINGEAIDAGDLLTIVETDGPVFYTLDGTDPRRTDPTINYFELIGESAEARVMVPTDDSLRSRWLETDFDDSSWLSGKTGIGFDASGDLAPHINFDIQDHMRSVNATAYVRIPFHVKDPSELDALSMDIQFDDGFVAFLNGVEIKRINAPVDLAWNARATIRRVAEFAANVETFNVSHHAHLLRAGKNVLAIQAMNNTRGGSDLLISPKLHSGTVQETGVSPAAHRYNDSFVMPSGSTLKARSFAGEWSPLREATSPTARSPLRISEVMYHPYDATPAEIEAGFEDADDFEFLELVNTSDEPVTLSNVQLVQTTVDESVNGVEFNFAEGRISQIGPAQRLLIVENEQAFNFRYGSNLPVVGQWTGGLNNNREQITLSVGPQILQQFTYQDDWYAITDGAGRSLEAIDLQADNFDKWNRAEGWQPSTLFDGTPGTASVDRLFGDANGDGLFNTQDLDQVFRFGEYEDDILGNSTFSEGDWNEDGDFTSEDLVLAFSQGYYAP